VPGLRIFDLFLGDQSLMKTPLLPLSKLVRDSSHNWFEPAAGDNLYRFARETT
jgi:hypothetical protein